MKNTVIPFEPRGHIQIPASKSSAIRALFAALITEKSWRLEGWSWCDDSYHALHAVSCLGGQVKMAPSGITLDSWQEPISTTVYAGESGLCARMLSMILLRYPYQMTLKAGGSLLGRPMSGIEDIYDQLGVIYDWRQGRLPLRMFGGVDLESDLVVDGSMTSQWITGLLYLLSDLGYEHSLVVKNLRSAPYVDMTLDILREFGAQWTRTSADLYRLESVDWLSGVYTIEGDWSAASIWVAMAALGGEIRISGLSETSRQADSAILTVPRLRFEWDDGDLLVSQQSLEGFEFDATDCPDLFPALVVLASGAQGPCRLRGVHRLRYKESDRATALTRILKALGLHAEIEEDTMIVYPGRSQGGRLETYGDHRMVMAVAALAAGGQKPVDIDGVEAVAKSYPSFFDDLRSVGALVN